MAGSTRDTGAERFLLQMAEHLDPEAFRMAVVLPRKGPLAEELRHRRIPVEILDLPFLVTPTAVRRLSKLLADWSPDIVQGHGVRSNLYARLAAKTVPCVATFHDTLAVQPLLRRWIGTAVDAATVNRSAAVVCAAECVRKEFLSRCPALWEKTHMIRPGVDLARFDPRLHDRAAVRRELNLGERWTLMVAGRLIEKKGHAFVLDTLKLVMNTLPPFRLLITGDGPLRKSLEKRAQALGLGEQVLFLAGRRDVPGLLAAADTVIVPSLSEDVPHVLLEALAMGKPVIASRVTGVTEIMPSEGEGLLVPLKKEKLIEAILTVLWNKDESRKRAENGRRRVSQEYDLKKIVGKWQTLYRETSGDILIK